MFFRKKPVLLLACLLLLFPLAAHAVFDFGGWVTNIPGAPGSRMSVGATLSPIYGYNAFWYPGPGSMCLNGLDEVNQLPARGVTQPQILLQAKGAYTFQKGPAKRPGQLILGKYFPAMVCMANYVFWVPCGPGNQCPEIVPLPKYFAPLIIFNGSSI